MWSPIKCFALVALLVLGGCSYFEWVPGVSARAPDIQPLGYVPPPSLDRERAAWIEASCVEDPPRACIEYAIGVLHGMQSIEPNLCADEKVFRDRAFYKGVLDLYYSEERPSMLRAFSSGVLGVSKSCIPVVAVPEAGEIPFEGSERKQESLQPNRTVSPPRAAPRFDQINPPGPPGTVDYDDE